MRFTSIVLLLGAAMCGAAPTAALADDRDTFTVNSTADPGDGNCATNGCTLREAMEAANDGDYTDTDQINLAFGKTAFNTTITLTSALPVIDEPMAIASTSVRTATINGNDAVRPFTITAPNDNVSLTRLVVTGGKASGSGGVQVTSGTVTIANSSIIGNSASGAGGGVSVGSQMTGASLVIADSTISNNTAGSLGGGVAAVFGNVVLRRSTISGNRTLGSHAAGGGVAIGSYGTAQIERSTISGNHTEGADSPGGGVYVLDPGTSIANSTIAANFTMNASSAGGGAFADGGSAHPTLTNSIVGDNLAASSSGNDRSDLASNAGDTFRVAFSLVETAAGAPVEETVAGSNVLGEDAALGPLGANGGPTHTHLLAPTSPAVDQGSTDDTADQRGMPRPVDLSHVANSAAAGGDGTDMGAVELTAAEGAPAPPAAAPLGTASPPPTPSDAQSAPGASPVQERATIRSLRLAPSTFPAFPTGPSARAAAKVKKPGTVVSFNANMPADVTYRVARKLAGRRVGRSCVAPKRSNRRKRGCTRLVLLRGSFTRPAKSGSNRFRFSGRLGGRRLSPGSYELRATPKAAGSSGPASRAAFRIVR